MFRKKAASPLLETAPITSQSGSAVDHIAAVTGLAVLALGLAQLLVPLVAAPLTGIEPGTASEILGLQWALFGGLLALGGVIRTRVITIFAAEFIMISAIVSLLVTFAKHHDMMPLIVHGSVAFIGLVSSGFARLSDKADLKKELQLLRARTSTTRDREMDADGNLTDA